MGYNGAYSLASRCFSEGFSTFTFVFFTLSILANKLLPKTKGHDLSYGWLAFGVGLAVFIPVQFLGHISSSLNPAMALGNAIVGNISWFDWPFIALSQTLGAFLAACLMYLYYYPQFRTEPEPPPARDAERLLRTRDDIGRRGLDFVSYNTRQPPLAPRVSPLSTTLRRRVNARSRVTRNGNRIYNAAEVLGPEAEIARPSRRRSVMVADLQSRLDRLENPYSQRVSRHFSETGTSPTNVENGEIYVEMIPAKLMEAIETTEDAKSGPPSLSSSVFSDSANAIAEMNHNMAEESTVAPQLTPSQCGVPLETVPEGSPRLDDESDPLMGACCVADRTMKLAIFCTRPTTYNPFINLLTEIVSTFFLVIGILFIKERSEFLFDGYVDVYRHGIMSFYIGLLISLLVLSMGGMGVAMNPARDLAPRFAHWILPIAGKGPSEWYYAWIPIVGPLFGSVIAGCAFLGMSELNKDLKDGALYDQRFSNLTDSLLM